MDTKGGFIWRYFGGGAKMWFWKFKLLSLSAGNKKILKRKENKYQVFKFMWFFLGVLTQDPAPENRKLGLLHKSLLVTGYFS